MNAKHLIAAAALAAATVTGSQPAAAYPLKITGRSLASAQLKVDVLRQIAEYSSRTGGCRFLHSAHMDVMPRSYVPRQPTRPALTLGGHFEVWTVNACAAKQRFQIAMWPSRRGGANFAVTPLTGRMSLATS
ncbi:hypothetical protein COC42_08420 [Sphingomonas spermidinifaciens]|uniref:Uncharacterized protein n=1 Tax=Sphingomonas spermidinifaciens TaxID=1141889 RepID=A0A2A4B8P8_9SPHN|nr:hypothetical protein [Sphingomonas spermidinifaciens]PCD04295.1 hypothetical protein COC42_08420 [Sphingomonas spermidinifaciens]